MQAEPVLNSKLFARFRSSLEMQRGEDLEWAEQDGQEERIVTPCLAFHCTDSQAGRDGILSDGLLAGGEQLPSTGDRLGVSVTRIRCISDRL